VPPQPFEIVPQFFPWAPHVVGVHVEAAAGFTVSTAVAVPARVAEMVVTVEADTAEVFTMKLALLCPAGMTTLAGTCAAALALERNAAAPPAGAPMFNVTVAADELPPVTEVGFSASADTLRVGAVPQTPGTPPPPHT